MRPLYRGDRFLLAAVVTLSIMYLGDAYGHLHQMWVNDNHAPDNTGLVLWADFILDIVESRGVAVLAILFGAFVALGMWKNIRISTRNGF